LAVKAGGSYLPDKNWSSSPSIGRDPGGHLLGYKEAQPIREMAGAVRTDIAT
jgi:hypothetical protein